MTCVFCAIVAGRSPAHIVLDEPHVLAFLDRRPVFPGHVLLVPKGHADTIVDLPPERYADVLGAGSRLSAAVVAGLGAQGTFMAINNVVSQSVPHLHLHVVPRTKGDGLRGFFWPRRPYADDTEAAEHASRIRAALRGPEGS